jgi:RecA-family ATPase
MTDNKKMTAPVSSAPTDAKQPICNNNTKSIADLPGEGNLQATNSTGEIDLKTISMPELYDTAYPPKMPIIDGLVYAGTYLFVGAPKIGKSFFMAQLGYHVSKGLPLWNYPVHKGTVLYLALEDDCARLQKRLYRMFGEEISEDFYFATESRNLNEGLEQQLNRFVNEHKDARLIIIDTLQKVREVGNDRFSYASDYDIVTKLKKFSDEHNVCLMVVHHTRKMESSDSFDMISGTNGLLGAADGAFVVQKEKRTDRKAVLEAAGRDQQEQRLQLEFDGERCIWNLTKVETELWKEPDDPVLKTVAKVVSEEMPNWSGTASELLELLPEVELPPNVLTRKLNIGIERLFVDYGVKYESSRGHNGRMIKLELVKEQA